MEILSQARSGICQADAIKLDYRTLIYCSPRKAPARRVLRGTSSPGREGGHTYATNEDEMQMSPSCLVIPLRAAGDDQVALFLGLGLPRDAAVMQVPDLLCQLQLYHPAAYSASAVSTAPDHNHHHIAMYLIITILVRRHMHGRRVFLASQ